MSSVSPRSGQLKKQMNRIEMRMVELIGGGGLLGSRTGAGDKGSSPPIGIGTQHLMAAPGAPSPAPASAEACAWGEACAELTKRVGSVEAHLAALHKLLLDRLPPPTLPKGDHPETRGAPPTPREPPPPRLADAAVTWWPGPMQEVCRGICYSSGNSASPRYTLTLGPATTAAAGTGRHRRSTPSRSPNRPAASRPAQATPFRRPPPPRSHDLPVHVSRQSRSQFRDVSPPPAPDPPP